MNRRSFLFGAGASLIAAPAIVRAASLMPVRGITLIDTSFDEYVGQTLVGEPFRPFVPPSFFRALIDEYGAQQAAVMAMPQRLIPTWLDLTSDASVARVS